MTNSDEVLNLFRFNNIKKKLQKKRHIDLNNMKPLLDVFYEDFHKENGGPYAEKMPNKITKPTTENTTTLGQKIKKKGGRRGYLNLNISNLTMITTQTFEEHYNYHNKLNFYTDAGFGSNLEKKHVNPAMILDSGVTKCGGGVEYFTDASFNNNNNNNVTFYYQCSISTPKNKYHMFVIKENESTENEIEYYQIIREPNKPGEEITFYDHKGAFYPFSIFIKGPELTFSEQVKGKIELIDETVVTKKNATQGTTAKYKLRVKQLFDNQFQHKIIIDLNNRKKNKTFEIDKVTTITITFDTENIIVFNFYWLPLEPLSIAQKNRMRIIGKITVLHFENGKELAPKEILSLNKNQVYTKPNKRNNCIKTYFTHLQNIGIDDTWWLDKKSNEPQPYKESDYNKYWISKTRLIRVNESISINDVHIKKQWNKNNKAIKENSHLKYYEDLAVEWKVMGDLFQVVFAHFFNQKITSKNSKSIRQDKINTNQERILYTKDTNFGRMAIALNVKFFLNTDGGIITNVKPTQPSLAPPSQQSKKRSLSSNSNNSSQTHQQGRLKLTKNNRNAAKILASMFNIKPV
uniref:Uncharacterized protein n=1 Tax=viral metagenome TaxID=1070528 RepID=A0A6C0F9U1_9ZZZZ|tara:strand:+ start:34 stop:1761 length:1728 start_codon:yes stop_codon:yes gene_type:complete